MQSFKKFFDRVQTSLNKTESKAQIKELTLDPRSDYKAIVESKKPLVDKSGFIADVLSDGSFSKVIVRPSGFGKTLNLTMLKYFLDISAKEENKKLFNGTAIAESKAFEQQGKHPVIFISLANIKGKNLSEAMASFKELQSKIYEQFEPILKEAKLDEFSMQLVKNIISKTSNPVMTKNGLYSLIRHLYTIYNKRVWLLFDDVDFARFKKIDPELAEWIGHWLQILIKDNPKVQSAVLTTPTLTMRAKFTSNATMYDLSYDRHQRNFGFSSAELSQVLGYTPSKEVANKFKVMQISDEIISKDMLARNLKYPTLYQPSSVIDYAATCARPTIEPSPSPFNKR